ncbi:MAG: proline--tRNA ligase [Candidatus Diapherotrites archaeon]|uniref:Proline--tRNA ligase n=1 Tax=Candidatus Iainarchaeum sp. TaxID=3101447 RepID=A0A8T4L828_9ARCH|nr:proline--tRNA ligase [Candidatus Diapherotrites archaeon]
MKPNDKKNKTSESKNVREDKVIFNLDKETQFSDWFTEIIKTAELADLRYNIKGFLVFQPWSVLAMEAMYDYFERDLQKRGHKPYWYPALIPKSNLTRESEHVKGFVPEVFWVTEHGNNEKLEEPYALRPTSETAFYPMFSIWVRSYKDLPFLTYQRAQVWRYETKATRPFLRSREFYWIETHCGFKNASDAYQHVLGDMQTTERVMHQIFGIPFIFFQRPQWDKFAGADNTFAADTIMPDGKIIQQPSTHMLGTHFAKAFNEKFNDESGQEQLVYNTCYGPAISRMFASVISFHGDNKGLRFPFEIAPVQVIITPIAAHKNPSVNAKALQLRNQLFDTGLRVEVDSSDKMPGEKFYYWEMKGVPIRIEIGPKELDKNVVMLYRRDTETKTEIKEKDLLNAIQKNAFELSANLRKQADQKFENVIRDAKDRKELEKIVNDRGFCRCNFCSINLDGARCAETVEKEIGATVRGKRIDKDEKPFGTRECVICKQAAGVVVYIGKQY